VNLSPQMSEVIHLAAKGGDSELSDDDVDRLESLFQDDGSLQQFYLELIELDLTMKWLVDSRSLDHALSAIETERAKPVKRRLIPPLTLPAIVTGSSMPVLAAILTVALLFYGTFTVISWNLRPDKLPSVAVVRDATDVQWSSGSRLTAARGTRLTGRRGTSIHPGESLKIESGTMELELNAGAKLIVEGPADWIVDGNNSVSLRSGKLIARVPRQAIGFTVETPTAKIVDLGTEFEVEVSKSGATEVQVSRGKVELHPDRPLSPGSTSPPVILSAGAARRIEVSATGESIVRDMAYEPHRFGPKAPATQAARLPVTGAMASSEFGFIRQAHTLINGSGLNGDRHVNYANHTMWISALGHVENEFVLFDLGRACQLDTMKVWNYNETRQTEADTLNGTIYQERGVAVADIYISDTGKWDPLKRPEEWRLVIPDHHFAPADGTTDYATPDVISLGEVKARFVAIVIKAKHQSDRPTPDMRCVGLSEVQFFGKRIGNSATK
jgi:hypothetical protein